MEPKETKVKVRRPRQPKAESAKKDKTIKIKLTTKENANAANGSEDEDEPEAAIEEHLIFRVPEGEMSEKLREIVKKREFTEDIKLQFKGCSLLEFIQLVLCIAKPYLVLYE
jgi:hypothetical protein